MSTKIVAARLGVSAGVTTVITRSSNPGNVLNIVQYLQSIQRGTTPPSPDERAEGLTRSASALSLSACNGNGAPWPPLHTRFVPANNPIRDRHFWLLHTPYPHGTLYIDSGAYKALVGKAGLLPVGVVDVEGNFAQQEVVRLVTVKRRSTPGPDGKMWEGTPEEVGRALVNYAAAEIARIKQVRAQGDCPVRGAALQGGHNACPADALSHIKTHIAQCIGDEPRRALFLEPEFRMAVQIATPPCHAFHEVFHALPLSSRRRFDRDKFGFVDPVGKHQRDGAGLRNIRKDNG